MSNGSNGNVAAMKLWIPLMVSVLLAAGSITFASIQAVSMKSFTRVEEIAESNRKTLAAHDSNMAVIATKMEVLAEKQIEVERRLTELVKGVNDLAKTLK